MIEKQTATNCVDLAILDCTVRDGSYAIDFKWPKEKVIGITRELAEQNFRYIEIGHGLGLGAERKYAIGCCSDREYIEAAMEVKGNARLGVFFIPGIGNFHDLDEFAKVGGDFVRIGTNVSETAEAEAYIKHAKNLGLEVCYNCMKSYAVKPFEFCKRMTEVASWGVNALYLVDSAGGMLPAEVARYVRLLKQCVDVRIGFHGHNNLMLANATALAAVEAGAGMVDTSLLGIGRGAGNAQTETMLLIFQKLGYNLGIDPIPVLKIAEKYIKPIDVPLKGIEREDVVLGYALFHSSYNEMMRRIAKDFGVDWDALIIEVANINRQAPSEELVRMVAQQLQSHKKVKIFFPKFCHKKLNG